MPLPHGFEGKGEDIGDRAYGVGRAAVNAANFGLGEAAKAFRSSREEYYRSRQNAQNTKKQGLNEDNINAQAAGVSGWFRQMFGKAETTRQTRSVPVPKSDTAQAAHCWQSAHVYGDLWHHGGFLSGCGGPVYAQCGGSAGSSAGQLYG